MATNSNINASATNHAGTNLSTSSKCLDELVKELDQHVVLQDSVKDLLLNMADDFIENVVDYASKLAKHRRSTLIDAKDIQFALHKHWNIHIPGAVSSGSSSTLQSMMATSSGALSVAKPKKGSIHGQRMDVKKHVLHQCQHPSRPHVRPTMNVPKTPASSSDASTKKQLLKKSATAIKSKSSKILSIKKKSVKKSSKANTVSSSSSSSTKTSGSSSSATKAKSESSSKKSSSLSSSSSSKGKK